MPGNFRPQSDRPVVAGEGLIGPVEVLQRDPAIGVRLNEVRPQRHGPVEAGQSIVAVRIGSLPSLPAAHGCPEPFSVSWLRRSEAATIWQATIGVKARLLS
jgi:hypothetical protein